MPAPPRTTRPCQGFDQKFQVGVTALMSLPFRLSPVGVRKVRLNDCVRLSLSESRMRGVIWKSPNSVWRFSFGPCTFETTNGTSVWISKRRLKGV